MAPPVEDEHQSDGGSDNEAETPRERVSEQAFDFFEFLKRFASPRVVQPYVLLLRQYEKNDRQTNHCLLRMMHRIAWDCKMYGLFFQASVFRIFQRILADPCRNTSPDIKEMSRFAVYIIRKFFENAEKNKKIFVEILFWKNSKEVYEMSEGYGNYEKSKSTILWTEEQEEELKSLYEQYKDVQEGGKDVVDLILEHMIDDSKTRRQVIRQLKVQSLIAAGDKLRSKPVRTRPPTEWQEEEIAELHTLHQKYKDAADVMGFIMARLNTRRPKQRVIEKMLELGIVRDRKELRKKRGKKTGEDGRKRRPAGGLVDGEESEVESSSEGEREIEDSSSESGAEADPEKPLDLASLKDAFASVSGQELQPAITWLKLSLESVAEDRQDGEDLEPSPLVPLQEVHHNAMQSLEFQNLLKTLGITPPASEQESFWRIPIRLSATALRARVEFLEKAESGDLGSSALDSLAASTSTGVNDSKKISKKRSHSEKKKKEHRKPKRKQAFDDGDSEESIEMMGSTENSSFVVEDEDASDKSPPPKKKRKRIVLHVSDLEDEDEMTRKTNSIKKIRSRILDDSDSSESEKDENWNEEMKDLTTEETGRDSYSGGLNFDSDDDDEPLLSKMKRKRADEKQRTSITSQDVSIDDEAPQEDSDVGDRRSNCVKKIHQRILDSEDED